LRQGKKKFKYPAHIWNACMPRWKLSGLSSKIEIQIFCLSSREIFKNIKMTFSIISKCYFYEEIVRKE
jgi:hypothetical protein